MSEDDQLKLRDKVIETSVMVKEIHTSIKNVERAVQSHNDRLIKEESATLQIQKDVSELKESLNNHMDQDEAEHKTMRKWMLVGGAILLVVIVGAVGGKEILTMLLKLVG